MPDFYQVLISLFGEVNQTSATKQDIVLAYPEDFNKIPEAFSTFLIQIEHTLVRRGGRGIKEALEGAVQDRENGEKFLVRLQGDRRAFNNAKTIIEYSRPNIRNVMESSMRSVYDNKAIYIAPLIRPEMQNSGPTERDFSKVFTSMNLGLSDDRRVPLLEELKKETNLKFENLSGHKSLSEVYSKVGVLLNLHQTNHHVTLEELRILPALLQGVIVVSESSPLIEEIPYAKFIIFPEAGKVGETLTDIMSNPISAWERIFGEGSQFGKVVREIKEANLASLSGRLR